MTDVTFLVQTFGHRHIINVTLGVAGATPMVLVAPRDESPTLPGLYTP